MQRGGATFSVTEEGEEEEDCHHEDVEEMRDAVKQIRELRKGVESHD